MIYNQNSFSEWHIPSGIAPSFGSPLASLELELITYEGSKSAKKKN